MMSQVMLEKLSDVDCSCKISIIKGNQFTQDCGEHSEPASFPLGLTLHLLVSIL